MHKTQHKLPNIQTFFSSRFLTIKQNLKPKEKSKEFQACTTLFEHTHWVFKSILRPKKGFTLFLNNNATIRARNHMLNIKLLRIPILKNHSLLIIPTWIFIFQTLFENQCDMQRPRHMRQ